MLMRRFSFLSLEKIFFLFFFFLFFFGFLSIPNSSFSQQFIIRCGVVAPQSSAWGDFAEKLANEVGLKTDGKVKIIWYFAGTQGDEPEMVKKVKDEKLECAGVSGHGLSKGVPAFSVTELPYLLKNYKEIDLLKEQLFSYFDEIFQNRGFKFVGWIDNGFIYVFSTFPISNLSDVEGKKFWVWEGHNLAEEIAKKVKEKYSVEPVPVEITNLPASLKSGKMDMFYLTPYATLAFGIHSKAKYMVKTPITYSFGGLVVNLKFWNSLPKDIQNIISEIAKQKMNELSSIVRKENDTALKVLLSKGMRMIDLDEQSLKDFEDTLLTLHDSLAGKLYPEYLLSEIKRRLMIIRARSRN